MAGADGAGWTFYSTAPACPLLTNLPTSSNRPNILKEFKRYQIPFGKSFHKLLEVLVDVLVEVCQLSGFSIGIRAMVSRHLPQTCDISAFLDVSKWHNQWAFSHGFPMVFPWFSQVFPWFSRSNPGCRKWEPPWPGIRTESSGNPGCAIYS